MITFQLYQGGLYLTPAGIANPSQARVGFQFQDAGRTDPTYVLSQETWGNPNTPPGWFVFFVPSSTRDWATFGPAVRGLFSEGVQFGWISEAGGAPALVSPVQVNSGGGTPTVIQSFILAFNNVQLSVSANPFAGAAVTFDDGNNTFQIANDNQAVQLFAQAPGQQQQAFAAQGSLTLAMDDAGGGHGGSVNAAFALATLDLAAFEAGFMYFSPPVDGSLQALSYPVFQPAGQAQRMGLSAWLDVLSPLDGTRSYLQFTDAQLGSYFTTSNGGALALSTTNGASASTSRLVFANRPVRQTSDTGTYYLTPAGAFGLGAPSARANLLCGATGTEFMDVATAGTPDTLVMQPGGAAYQQTTAADGPGQTPVFLTDVGGNVTTSWVELVTAGGSYVSQPQESPLYDQNGTTAALGGPQANGGLTLYLLDFLPLASWQAPTNGTTAGVGAAPEITAPAVPMVPYGGLRFTNPDAYKPYLAIESNALNPTRKNAFSAAQASLNARARSMGLLAALDAAPDPVQRWAMTPQGLLAGLDAGDVWTATRIAVSEALDGTGPEYLEMDAMTEPVRQALQQNQIFLVTSSLDYPGQNVPLFDFSNDGVNISGWPFSLSPAGTPASDGTPPILILKFYPGQSITDLVNDTSLWSQAWTFNGGAGFGPPQAQAYIQTLIAAADADVAEQGTSSLYYNFSRVVADPAFAGVLALNANMQLNSLPTAIRAVTGGMTKVVDGETESNIDAFRVHHVGVSINDTDPDATTPTLAQSSLFGLVDYEKPATTQVAEGAVSSAVVDYGFEVEYLRALFTNSELSSFSCKINLTINSLFGTDVNLDPAQSTALLRAEDAAANVVVITGSYQAHSTSGDDTTSGEGVYSFVAEGNFKFTFGENPYLDTITLTKLQFSFQQETPTGAADTSTIQAAFGVWGSMVFKEFDVLDIFSFQQLAFNDLGIAVQFDLNAPPAPTPPSTANLSLTFNPGNLRLDLAASPARQGSTSMLSLLPFKLTSFLYNEFPDQQTLGTLQYFSLSSVPLGSALSLTDRFNYGLIFELDLGGWGALAGPLAAFKFSFIVGWLTETEGATAGQIAFGVQLPEANGKLEITIQGVLKLMIERFVLKYNEKDASMLVVSLQNSYIEILGQRLPPGNRVFDFALFAPLDDASRIGWLVAVNTTETDGGGVAQELPAGWSTGTPGQVASGAARRYGAEITPSLPADGLLAAGEDAGNGGNGEGGDSPVFDLVYLGLGQRTGPDPASPPTTFDDFLKFMRTDFWEKFNAGKYDEVYHADGQWLAITQFKLLGVVEVGFIFYDVTPFYSLQLNVAKLFNFEITYTKISDSIGLFYASFSLPDNLRTFQVGAASLTLPSIGVSVYTNGDWKLDVGFPAGDDWSRSFRVQAQAGPVPVTGSGGFYIASLSSATSPDTFKGTYPSIVAFGFAARLGVGKDFVAGPLKAGVSVTFFGIIQGAAGYLSNGSTDIFQTPDALSLSGQFGIIGELYGSVDFVIIKASVNVRLQASIGIVLTYERTIPNSGSILLYIEASVSVSVKVEINLGLFSISISFSFRASFRFEWQLLPAGSTSDRMLAAASLRGRRTMLRSLAAESPTALVLPLQPGLPNNLALWFLPEGTVVFPNPTGTGTPWVATTLGIEYADDPSTETSYAAFKPFEALTAQLTTWAMAHALPEAGGTYTLDQVAALDQDPDALVGWIDYPTLLAQLAVFDQTTLTTPDETVSKQVYGATFPMPPFLQLQTTGRLDGNGKADDLGFVYATKNVVDSTYIAEVDAYFNQLFVNQTSGGAGGTLLLATDEPTTTPLVQEIFLNYFTGLVRGGVHGVLQAMQNQGIGSGTAQQLILAAVADGQVKSLAGQMSSSFRGGARLPYTAGLTVPGGAALQTTNPLYALLWQEFPVGGLGASNQYAIALSNPDTTQTWLTSTATWNLTSAWLAPLASAVATDVIAPTAPVQLPFTDVGPQAFSLQNPVTWTQAGGATSTLFPFPANLRTLQSTETGAVSVLVQSRQGGAPYLPGGTSLPASSFTWATQITLAAAQIPVPQPPPAAGAPAPAAGSGESLKDVFSLSGASQQDQALLEQIIQLLAGGTNPIASIQVLYQTSAGAAGLNSGKVTPANVFVLRTNTTTVSAPPAGPNLMLMAVQAEPAGVPVGADIDDDAGFLQIIQQAAVTNAPGYYLRYLDDDGNSLPTALFTSGPAPVTLLVTYTADGSLNTPASPAQVQPFYNAVAVQNVESSLLYYAETTDPALSTQYASVAAGSMGVLLTQSESAALVQPAHPTLTAMADALPERRRGYLRSEVVQALVDRGMTDPEQVHAALAETGGTASQLNALYSLVTYQVQATSGFVQSNLSAPVQPQQPDAASSAADGLTLAADDDGDTSSFRVYVPLYNLAEANQATVGTRPLNRYADIGQPVQMEFYQNDAFGNQMPSRLPFSSTNLYFDAIVPIDEWQGVVTAYDFAGGAAATVNVYLEPSETAFAGMSADAAWAALQAYYTIQDQLGALGVTLWLETNLAVDADGGMVKTQLTSQQTGLVTGMVAAMVTWLEALYAFLATGTGTVPVFNVPKVTLTTAVSGAGTLAPVWELVVMLGIEREQDLISPLLISGGVVTFPAAQNRYTTIVPTVGASLPDGSGSISIDAFAAAFVQSFPALILSVGLGGAQQAAQRTSSAGQKRALLRAEGVSSDGTGSGAAAPQSLWAVQKTLIGIQVGQTSGTGPFYLSPTPLDNTLNTATVPLPPLPPLQNPPTWPAQQLFTDVDLDRLNANFFAAVDAFLSPASAAQAFEQVPTAYDTVANGRRSLADQYAAKEVDWLFGQGAPWTGTGEQLTEAQTALAQQMRAGLGTAYAVDTVVQFGVSWTQAPPRGLGDLYSLYGQVRPTGGAELQHGFTISTSQVPVVDTGTSLLTFLFGAADVQDTASASLDLEFNVTHVQHFLEPAGAVPDDEARPSIWLQLVNPYPGGAPHVGPAGPVEIPLVFRQYPTPPTLISQQAPQGSGTVTAPGNNPLTAAAAWHLLYRYQVQLTPHDRIASAITYNTSMTTSSSGGGGQNATLLKADDQLWTLFQSLARFSATYAVLQPVLADLSASNTWWAGAAESFAALVQGVVTNTTWNPPPTLMATRTLARVTDDYTITDVAQTQGQQLITLTWAERESSFDGATLSIVAVSPQTGEPYPGQRAGTVPNGITDLYTPEPPLVDDWVIHQLEVDGLNVLAAENALAGVQVQRNVITMESGGTAYTAQAEFIYNTPMVRATQPITPFVDNDDVIDITTLPNQGIGTGCPTTTTPPGIPGLCQRIYTLMYDLLVDDAGEQLMRAQALAGMQEDEGAPRRVKVACSYQYRVAAAGGVPTSLNPVSPLVPVVLARSFVIDGTQPDQLSDFSGAFATAVAQWAGGNGITLGAGAQAGSQLVFDITLYAQISGLNTPVLRLRNLQLALSAIAV
jgi:hypothetical protein